MIFAAAEALSRRFQANIMTTTKWGNIYACAAKARYSIQQPSMNQAVVGLVFIKR